MGRRGRNMGAEQDLGLWLGCFLNKRHQLLKSQSQLSFLVIVYLIFRKHYNIKLSEVNNINENVVFVHCVHICMNIYTYIHINMDVTCIYIWIYVEKKVGIIT